MNKVRMDNTIRIFVIMLTIVAIYFVSLSVFQVASQQRTMMEMMQGYQNTIPNAISIILALVGGLIVSMITTSEKEKLLKNDKSYALRIVKKKLSEDEKKLLKEVEKAGKITQDSLRARLNWSKAKISTTLTRLDKMNLIQKERVGKTYNIFLSRDFKNL